jgi:flagellar hook protein FlgE
LAINGDGWFVMDANFGRGYSRDGSFHFDKEGFLINGDGYRVLGYGANEKGKVGNALDHIRLGNTTVPAQSTTEVEVSMNLDTREKIMAFNPEEPEKTSSFNTGITVYDNVGTARLVTLYFNKTGDNQCE